MDPPKTDSSVCISPFEQFDKSLSCSFQDIGRESLGILHPEHFNRVSEQLMNVSLSDSFNHNSFFQKSIFPSEDYGRESLGILELTKLDIKFGDETIRETVLPNIEGNDSVPSLLDTAFLDFNATVSGGSVESQMPINTQCYSIPEELSKIFVLSKNQSITNSSNAAQLSLFNNFQLTSLELVSPRTGNDQDNARISSYSETDCFKDDGDHLSVNNIFDGSPRDDSTEDLLLDSITEPNWPQDFDQSAETEAPIVETQNVFKAIDKMIPINLQIDETDPQCKNQSSNPFTTEEITETQKRSSTRLSIDAREILQNLSNILNDERRDVSQKSKGQSLISTLVEMFCIESSDSSSSIQKSDSGTSASLTDELQVKNKPDNLLNKMTRSVSKKTDCLNREINLPHKENLKTNQPLIPHSLKTSQIERGTKTGVIVDKSEKKIASANSKVKFIRSKSPVLKPKGPLKAVIPLKDMKRNSTNNIPPKSDQSVSSNRTSRISTPVRDYKNKPRTSSPAARTAIISISPVTKKNSNDSNSSSTKIRISTGTPTVAPKRKIDRMESPSSIPKSAYRPYRRSSVSESRRNSDNKGKTLPTAFKRSHSVDNGLDILTDRNKIGQNFKAVPSTNARKTSLTENNNIVGSGITTKIKTAVMSTRPRGGKENLKP